MTIKKVSADALFQRPQTLGIEMWGLKRIIPYARNARVISQSAIDKVAASLKEFGWQQSIVVDTEGVIVAGHTRLKAAQKLGWVEAPVHVASELTAAQIKAYRLMDNRSRQESLWNTDILGTELGELKALDFNLDLTGFDDFELGPLLEEESTTKRLFQTETVELSKLTPHPRNYRQHPEDQIAHLVSSIQQHGFYRNIVVAKDGTILAGHGMVKACEVMGLDRAPVVRLNIEANSIEAMKVIAGDNAISALAETDDRSLTELLKEIKNQDEFGLLGTGYDDMMLANLLFVTRPKSEIEDMDRAAEWAGMPEFDNGEKPIRLIISFETPEARADFVEEIGLTKTTKKESTVWMAKWPPQEGNDLASVKFQ